MTHVERAILVAQIEPESDKGKEEASQTVAAEVDQRDEPVSDLGEPRLIVKRIWGHDSTGVNGLEYLVGWETKRHPERGQWVRAADLDADELIDEYMTRFHNGRAEPPTPRKQRCRHNGQDYGCDHLRCRHDLWVRAMECMEIDVSKWVGKKKVKARKRVNFRGAV